MTTDLRVLEHIDGFTGDHERDHQLFLSRAADLARQQSADGIDRSDEQRRLYHAAYDLSAIVRAHNGALETDRLMEDTWFRAEAATQACTAAYEDLSWPGSGTRWIAKHHAWCVRAAEECEVWEEWAALVRKLLAMGQPLRDRKALYDEHVQSEHHIYLDLPDPDGYVASVKARHEDRLRVTAQTLGPLGVALRAEAADAGEATA